MLKKIASIIKVINLKKQFFKPGTGKKEVIKAVDDVSFEIKLGQVFGLIGASGSGKTTILKIIFSIIKADKGQVFLENKALTRDTSWQQRKLLGKMGLVLQDPYNSLCPRYTVNEILTEPLIIHGQVSSVGQAENQVRKMLGSLELPLKYYNKYPHELSGGERQRVALGRALMLEPIFLALDEPTSMLDASTKRGMVCLIKNLADEMDLAVLLVTHDLAMAAYICDYIGVMKDGKIIEEGDCADIVNNPQSDYTKQLLLAATDLKKFI